MHIIAYTYRCVHNHIFIYACVQGFLKYYINIIDVYMGIHKAKNNKTTFMSNLHKSVWYQIQKKKKIPREVLKDNKLQNLNASYTSLFRLLH